MHPILTALALTALCAAGASAELKAGSLSIKGGETLVVGDKVTVSFVQTLGRDGKYDFYFSKNGGASWSEFATRWQGPTGDGDTVKHLWTVPNAPTTMAQWRACQLAGGECTNNDYILKSGVFTIAAVGSAVRGLPGAAGMSLEFDPASRGITAAFTLAAAGRVTLEAFDSQGRLLAALIDGEKPAGTYALPLSPDRLRAVRGATAFRLACGDAVLVRFFAIP
jgi:hypothetical protein